MNLYYRTEGHRVTYYGPEPDPDGTLVPLLRLWGGRGMMISTEQVVEIMSRGLRVALAAHYDTSYEDIELVDLEEASARR